MQETVSKSKSLFDSLFDAADAEWNDELANPTRDTAADAEARKLSGIGNNRSTKAPVDEGERFNCGRCQGTGMVEYGYRYIRTGKCFKCNGRGYFKTSAETRAKQKAQRVASKKAKAARNRELAQEWLTANPDIAAWFKEQQAPERTPWEFAESLWDALMKYGELTEKQEAAARKCAVKSAERKAERAKQQADRKPDAKPAFALKLQEAFERVLATGASRRRLRLTIGCLRFNRAPDEGRNPGCLYVKDTELDLYIGKITRDGEFWKSRDAEQKHLDQLNAIGDDPLAEAQKHGHETGSCSCCGRTLTDPASIEAGIGPVCRNKWGW